MGPATSERPVAAMQDRPVEGARSRRAGEAKAVCGGASAPKATTRPRRSATGGAGVGGTPAAVLHTDGLWMPDRTKIELAEPVAHLGNVAELAYTYNLGYQLTPARGEKPGTPSRDKWITEDACRDFGIDVDTLLEAKPKRRDEVMREITQGIPFVADAVADGWKETGRWRC